MSSTAVRTAFHTALAAAVPPTVPVVDIENLDVVPALDTNGLPTMFVGLLYFATEDVVTIGAPGNERWRELGTVSVVVYAPAGRGASAAVSLADSIRNAFAGRDLPVTGAGRRLTVLKADPLSSYFNRPGQPTGMYYIGMVGLTYQYDFIR